MSETSQLSEDRYIKGLKHFQQLECDKWKSTIKVSCRAYLNSAWNQNTCKVTDRDCNFEDCFALQIIKAVKGHL